MSAEANVIRDAKDRTVRAAKLNYAPVSARWVEDDQFQRRMLQEGKSHEDMQRCLPDPGRSEEQRHLGAGSHYSSTDQGVLPGKLIVYAHCEVEPLRTH